MKLSELKTGEKAVIVKVTGHGGFRKRIIEMGFVREKTVEVLLNAPLQDPVKYKVMGYEVSLRRQEAEMIEVITEEEFSQLEATGNDLGKGVFVERAEHQNDYLQHEALKQRRTISVALVGNPNCGKTSLFNYASGAHARVGNYSGVTVDAAEAHASFYGYDFDLVDLPGTYSLSCYSPEELYVREHLTKKMPDVVINVIDASNIERNLYLTTQLVDMDIPIVGALNMYDEFERRGDHVDLPTLSTLFGMPLIPTSFKNGSGVKELFRAVIQVYEGTSREARHNHINYGHEIEDGIRQLQSVIRCGKSESNNEKSPYAECIPPSMSTRYIAIKLLEGDKDIENLVEKVSKASPNGGRLEGASSWRNIRDIAAARVLEETNTDAETAITDAKYGFIHGALTEAKYRAGTKEDTYRTTHLLDRMLSNRWLGFPIFFALLFLMFHVTFVLGQ